MIASTLGFAMHLLVSSLKVIGPVGRALEYLLPQYRNMGTKAVKGINFNSKHLRKGDPLPPYTGKLRLYNMRYCPFAQRTVLALNAKNIDYEVVNVNLFEKPEWLPSKSAFGKVPALEVKEGVSIYESLVTVEYLDDVYPQRPLLSKDPLRKAFDKIIVESTAPISSLFIKLLKAPQSVTDENISAYHKALDFLQDQLRIRGTKYFGGDQPAYVDYMNWPWFERILALEEVESRLRIDSNKYKLFVEYLELMKKDPVVSEYMIPNDILLKFIEPYRTGAEVNYELMTV